MDKLVFHGLCMVRRRDRKETKRGEKAKKTGDNNLNEVLLTPQMYYRQGGLKRKLDEEKTSNCRDIKGEPDTSTHELEGWSGSGSGSGGLAYSGEESKKSASKAAASLASPVSTAATLAAGGSFASGKEEDVSAAAVSATAAGGGGEGGGCKSGGVGSVSVPSSGRAVGVCRLASCAVAGVLSVLASACV